MFITGSRKRDEMRAFDLPLPCVIPGPAGNLALVPADEKGEVISFFAWINGQERTREEWRILARRRGVEENHSSVCFRGLS